VTNVFADSFTDDLARRVASIVLESLPASAPHSPWLNVERAADYLDTTPDAIRGMVKRGQVPVHRSSTGRLLFRREDLDAHAMGEPAA
jgi:excisionase family DNA binding protein